MHDFDRERGSGRLPAWSRRAPLALLVLALDACHVIFPYSASRDGGGAPGDGDLALRERGGDVRGREAGEGGPDGGFPKGHCTSAGWCWEHPLPHGNRLNAVWGSDENNVYAVGDAGTLLHCDAKSCSAVQAPSGSECLLGIWGSSAQNIYVVGERWTVLHYDGNFWSVVNLGLPPSYDNALTAVWGTGPKDVFVVGQSGVMFHYDGVWTKHSAPTGLGLHAVGSKDGSSPVYAAANMASTGLGYVYQWARATKGWTLDLATSTKDELSGLWVHPASGDVLVVGQGVTWKRTSGKWSSISTPNEVFNAVWGDAVQGVFAVTGSPWSGGSARLLKLDANATGWSSLGTTSFTKELRGVWGAASSGGAQKLLLVGAGATVVRWQGSFTRQHPTRSIASSTLKAVWAKSSTGVVAVGDQGTILRRGPTGWTKEAWGGDADLNAVWGPDDGGPLLVAVGASGTILHYDGSWTPRTSHTATTLEAVWGRSASDIWAVGDPDPAQSDLPAIVHWNGAEWQVVPAPPETAGKWLDAVWGTGKDDEVYAAGLGQLILRLVGSAWTVARKGSAGAPSFYGMWGTAASNIYLTAEANGGIWLFDSVGQLTAVGGPLSGNMRFVWGDASRQLVVGDFGQVLNIKSGVWTAEDAGCGNSLHGVWTAGGVAYAVGESGTILSSAP